jgi:hypothetical protein
MFDAGMGAAVAAVAQGAKSFAEAAADGSFSVSDTGGRALLQAIHEMKDWIDSKAGHLNELTQTAQLGGSHGAQAMKPFLQNVASDQEGFITMLQAFRKSLNDAEQGIKDAMGNYHHMDSGVAKQYNV